MVLAAYGDCLFCAASEVNMSRNRKGDYVKDLTEKETNPSG